MCSATRPQSLIELFTGQSIAFESDVDHEGKIFGWIGYQGEEPLPKARPRYNPVIHPSYLGRP